MEDSKLLPAVGPRLQVLSPKLHAGLAPGFVYWWSSCPFCRIGKSPECRECEGTNSDPLPWAELFAAGRLREYKEK